MPLISRPHKGQQCREFVSLLAAVIPAERITRASWDAVLDAVWVQGGVADADKIKLFRAVHARFTDESRRADYLDLVQQLWARGQSILSPQAVAKQLAVWGNK